MAIATSDVQVPSQPKNSANARWLLLISRPIEDRRLS